MDVTASTEQRKELRVRMHRHLREYPGLSAYDLMRALRISSVDKARRALRDMERDGEARSMTVPKGNGDMRLVTRWSAS